MAPMMDKLKVLVAVGVFQLSSLALAVMPDARLRYATDAYPGFDCESEIVSPSKKDKPFFAFLAGPKFDNAADQLRHCRQLASEGSVSAAKRACDKLVRFWPYAPEAASAQLMLAELLSMDPAAAEEAFAEYRYLADYYSSECDYAAVTKRLYELAWLMRRQGKRLIFFRFKNSVDVRRSFEAAVLRSPGSVEAPKALFEIARLREEEGKDDLAVKTFENLRNLYPTSAEADRSLLAEGAIRVRLLKEHAYNLTRAKDTLGYLEMAVRRVLAEEDRRQLEAWRQEAVAKIETEEFLAAKFYDSRTRTPRSAINAYERFIEQYPASVHVEAAKARLLVLKGE